MKVPQSPHREVVDPENAEVLGTLDGHSWAAFQEAWTDATFFQVHAAIAGLQKSLRMTGSVGGEHRKDLVVTLQGAKQPTIALGVTPQANGHTGPVEVQARRRPGL